MNKCKFEFCNEEKAKGMNGYCARHYMHSTKGDKKMGVYEIAFHSKNCTNYYVGKAFAQDINREVTKHLSAIRRKEKGKDAKLNECLNNLCLEHPGLDRNGVIDNNVDFNVLVEHDALGGYGIKWDKREGKWVEVKDKDEIRELYLKKYENFISKYFTTDGLKKGIKYMDMTSDEKEILQFINYGFLIIDKEEMQKINEYKKKYGEFCLNSNKVKR
jgi:hypothetical protein